MAVDMFIKIGDIKGESTDSKHKDEIDVLAWSWGVSQSGSMHTGAGGGAGKASFQDLSLTKWIDASSTKLLKASATGEHIPKAELTVRKAGGTPLEYLKIIMNDCLISSVSTGGSGGEERLTENISINFAKIEYQYVPQKEDGTPKGTLAFKFDIKAYEAK